MVLKKSLQLLKDTSNIDRHKIMASPRLSQSYINLRSQFFPNLGNAMKSSMSSATLSFLSNIKGAAADSGSFADKDLDQMLELLDEAISTLPQEMDDFVKGTASKPRPFLSGARTPTRTVSNPPLVLNETTENSIHSSAPQHQTSDSPRRRTLTAISSVHLQARLLDALATPYVDSTIRTSQRGQNSRRSSLHLSTIGANAHGPPVSPISDRAPQIGNLQTSMSTLNLVNTSTSPQSEPGFNISPLHPLSSKYSSSHVLITTSTDSPFTIFSCNDMACLCFGTSQSDLKNKPFVDIISPMDKQRFLNSSHSFNTSNKSEVLVCGDLYSFKKKDGSESFMSIFVKNNHRKVMIWILEEVRCDFTKLHVSRATGNIYKIEGAHSEVLLARNPAGEVSEKDRLGISTEPLSNNYSSSSLRSESENSQSEGKVDGKGRLHHKSAKSIDLSLKVDELLPTLSETFDQLVTDLSDNSKVPPISYQSLQVETDFALPCRIRVDSSESTDETIALQLYSLPHMSGMIIIDQKKLKICDYNKLFLNCLLGYDPSESLLGREITSILPKFQHILAEVLTNFMDSYDDKPLGLVIPEFTMRKAAKKFSSHSNSNSASQSPSPDAPDFPAFKANGSFVEAAKPFADLLDSTTIEAVSAAGTLVKIDLQLRIITPSHYALWVTYCRHVSGPGLEPPSQLALLDDYLNKRAQQKAKRKKHCSGEHSISSRSSTSGSNISAGLSTDSGATADSARPATPVTLSDRESTELVRGDSLKELTKIERPRKPEGPYSEEVGAHRRTRTLDDFTILNQMGEGAYGKVLMVKYKQYPDVKVVLKCVIKERILVDTWTRDRKLGTIPNEIKIMASLNSVPHKNIVEFLDFFEDEKYYHIEMVPHGNPGTDLFDLIEMRPDMEEEECKIIFKQVVDAVAHLHKHGIVHRDIKDENIVVDEKGEVNLIDFGSAAFIKQGPFDVFVGTIDYAAPEVLSGNPYEGKPQDVWALGILLYTVVYKENPFYNVDEIMDGDLRIPFDVSENCIDLIRMILARNTRQRPTIHDVAAHPWFTGSTTTAVAAGN